MYWFAVVLSPPNGKDDSLLIKENLLKMFADFNPLVTKMIGLTSVAHILRNDIYDLEPMRKWHKNNICLIGDAGHATTPNMGQGGAQAIEDAHYLSNLIVENSGENIFELFQQKRQKKVNLVVNQSWTTGKMAHWKYGKGLRDFLLKKVPKKIIEKKMIELYEIEKFHN